MENPYEKYKKRLFTRMQDNPELQLMNQSISKLSRPFQEINNQLQASLQQGNASAGAKVQATLRGQQQLQGVQQQLYEPLLNNMTMRNTQIQEKYADLSMQEEQWEDQQKAEKAQKNTKILRAGLTIAAMAVGALLAAPTGGVSLVAGASIGASLGTLGGGFMGINKKGNLSVDPDDWDAEAIVQGASGVLSTYASHLNEQSVAQMSNDFATKMNDPKIMETLATKMPKEQLYLWYGQITGAIMRGDRPTFDQLLNSLETISNPTPAAGFTQETYVPGEMM